MEPFEEVKIILSSSQERRRGEPGLKVGEDDKDGHSLDFFLFLPAQLRLRELIGEEEKLQEIDALAHPTGMMVLRGKRGIEGGGGCRNEGDGGRGRRGLLSINKLLVLF